MLGKPSLPLLKPCTKSLSVSFLFAITLIILYNILLLTFSFLRPHPIFHTPLKIPPLPQIHLPILLLPLSLYPSPPLPTPNPKTLSPVSFLFPQKNHSINLLNSSIPPPSAPSSISSPPRIASSPSPQHIHPKTIFYLTGFMRFPLCCSRLRGLISDFISDGWMEVLYFHFLPLPPLRSRSRPSPPPPSIPNSRPVSASAV